VKLATNYSEAKQGHYKPDKRNISEQYNTNRTMSNLPNICSTLNHKFGTISETMEILTRKKENTWIP
jgi:hypothetical protein